MTQVGDAACRFDRVRSMRCHLQLHVPPGSWTSANALAHDRVLEGERRS